MHGSTEKIRRVMTGFSALAAVIFLAVSLSGGPSVLGGVYAVHIVLAAGIMPLITAAMIYFTPVLTRSRPDSGLVLALPLFMLMSGAAATVGFYYSLVYTLPAAILGAASALLLLYWILRRARRMPGSPHPCLYWYALALVCLALGLTYIALAILVPSYWTEFRSAHLHLNTMGFIGMTAIGTLRVLIPTAGNYVDDTTRSRMRRDLFPVFGGSLLIAAGAALYPPMALLGALLWTIPVSRWVYSLLTRWRNPVWHWHGAGVSLAAAAAGWLLIIAAGAWHGAGRGEPSTATILFIYLFVFSLVTGAAGYLLPRWVRPGRTGAQYAEVDARLSRWSGLRTVFFVSGASLLAADVQGAAFLLTLGLVLFGWRVYCALRLQ